MEIEYSIKKDCFKEYQLSYYMMKNRKKIKKKPNKLILPYSLHIICWILLVFLFNYILLFINYLTIRSAILFSIQEGILYAIMLTGISFLGHIVFGSADYRNKPGGVIKVEEKGISDISDARTVFAKYDQIEFVYLYEKVGMIVLKDSNELIFFIDYNKEKLLKAIKKHHKELCIIEK